jgi:Uma2 family endonuclease
MVSTSQKNIYTEQEYLELERKAEYKSEFFKGEIFAMAGTSNSHNMITVNFLLSLGPKLKDKNCRPFGSDMRIHTPINSLYAYPDISVVCGEKKFLDSVFDTLLNPVFICEVLSRSTADYDTGGKFMRYRSIDSLKEYWVVSSLEYRLQKFVKQANGNWLLSETTSVSDTVEIECLSTDVSLKEIYFEVEF